MDSRIRQAVTFMHENLSRRVTGKELARNAGLSDQHFCVLFKAELGETPGRYLSQLRMERARGLLEASEYCHLTVKEVAALVGCYDLSHFVRGFQKRFGLSPRRYRMTRDRTN